MTFSRQVIALGARLKECSNVLTLGVRPNFSDYSADEANRIRRAKKIYYPSTFYADLFDSIGKPTFPSYHTYKCVQDKIKQTALFYLANIPHPKTTIFYGNRQKRTILDFYKFPFVAKIPRGSAMGRGVYLLKNKRELDVYLELTGPAYIQEYLETDRSIRAVVIGNKVVHAYWRIASSTDFRSNIAAGATICFDPVPDEALDLAVQTAGKCRWDDVGLDIILHGNKPYIIEANIKYGMEGFRKAGIDYLKLMESMIENNEI